MFQVNLGRGGITCDDATMIRKSAAKKYPQKKDEGLAP